MRSVFLALLLCTPASAFHGYPKGGPHDRVTRRAAEVAELSSSAETALKRAVREVDLREMAIDLRAAGSPRMLRGAAADAVLQPRCNFDGAHHFQRRPDQEVEAVLRQARGVLKRARAEALSALEDGDRDAAIDALGLALHVLQDFFANTNLTSLDEVAAPQMIDWLLGYGEYPAGVDFQLVVYEPCAEVVGEGELRTSLQEAESACDSTSRSAFCMSVASRQSYAGSKRDAYGHLAFDMAVGFATDTSIRWIRTVQRDAGDTWAVLQ